MFSIVKKIPRHIVLNSDFLYMAVPVAKYISSCSPRDMYTWGFYLLYPGGVLKLAVH